MNPNGYFNTPSHFATKMFVAGVPASINVDTSWTTTSGYTLKDETVSCSVKMGSYQYCQTKSVVTPTGTTARITYTFTVSNTGTYSIYTYSTGKLSDDSELDPLADGMSAHCS